MYLRSGELYTVTDSPPNAPLEPAKPVRTAAR
jgi:hypothetical protein